MVWSARQHHDWQLDSFPAGYFSPESTPNANSGNTLILTHTDRMQPKVADVMLGDDRLIEVSSKGEIVWDWVASDHIDELGFASDARSAIKAARSFNKPRGSYDWLHVNSATYVGPNQWFDKGDMRFAPNNVIISSREASLLAIVGRDGSLIISCRSDRFTTGMAAKKPVEIDDAEAIGTSFPGFVDLMNQLGAGITKTNR